MCEARAKSWRDLTPLESEHTGTVSALQRSLHAGTVPMCAESPRDSGGRVPQGPVSRGGQAYLRQLDADSPRPKVLRCINRVKLAPYSRGSVPVWGLSLGEDRYTSWQLDADSPRPKVLRCINRAKLAPYSAGLEQARFAVPSLF